MTASGTPPSSHLDGQGVPQLMWGEASTDTRCGGSLNYKTVRFDYTAS
jgi:hypothetical protein